MFGATLNLQGCKRKITILHDNISDNKEYKNSNYY